MRQKTFNIRKKILQSLTFSAIEDAGFQRRTTKISLIVQTEACDKRPCDEN